MTSAGWVLQVWRRIKGSTWRDARNQRNNNSSRQPHSSAGCESRRNSPPPGRRSRRPNPTRRSRRSRTPPGPVRRGPDVSRDLLSQRSTSRTSRPHCLTGNKRGVSNNRRPRRHHSLPVVGIAGHPGTVATTSGQPMRTEVSSQEDYLPNQLGEDRWILEVVRTAPAQRGPPTVKHWLTGPTSLAAEPPEEESQRG